MAFLFLIVFNFWSASFMDALLLQAASHTWTVRLQKDWFQVHGAYGRRASPGIMDKFPPCLPLIAAYSAHSSPPSWAGALERTYSDYCAP